MGGFIVKAGISFGFNYLSCDFAITMCADKKLPQKAASNIKGGTFIESRG
jgi:hypothetical protein